MGTEEYFQLIIYTLIWLTLITLFLLFLYTVYGKEEQSSPEGARFSGSSERIFSFDRLMICLLL